MTIIGSTASPIPGLKLRLKFGKIFDECPESLVRFDVVLKTDATDMKHKCKPAPKTILQQKTPTDMSQG